jgi:hypothetical protein
MTEAFIELSEDDFHATYPLVQNHHHLVNRIGYLVSTLPVPDEVSIQVHIPMQAEGEADDTNGEANV